MAGYMDIICRVCASARDTGIGACALSLGSLSSLGASPRARVRSMHACTGPAAWPGSGSLSLVGAVFKTQNLDSGLWTGLWTDIWTDAELGNDHFLSRSGTANVYCSNRSQVSVVSGVNP